MTKICPSCSQEKDGTLFPKNKRLPDGLGYECKECAHARYQAWSIARPSHIKDRNKNHYRKNRSDVLAKKRAERLADPEKFRERDAMNARNNRAMARAKCAKRRSSRQNATPKWLTEDHHTMMKIAYRMATLLEERMGVKYHVDHIHPLNGENFCGLHVPWNLQVIPWNKNIAKGNRLEVTEF